MPNDSPEFKLGQLDQFKTDICERVDKLEILLVERLERVELKVDKNRVWRIKTVAFTSGVSAVVSAVLTLIAFYYKLK